MEAYNGNTLYTTYINKIKLDILVTNKNNNNKEYSLTIKDVYYYYKISTNLISLGTLIRNRLSFRASKKRLTVNNNDRDIIIKGTLVNTLFKLRLSDFNNSKTKIIAKALVAKKSTDQRAPAKFWHKTIDHLNYNDLAKFPKIIEGI